MAAQTFTVTEIWGRSGSRTYKWEHIYKRKFRIVSNQQIGPATAIEALISYAGVNLGVEYNNGVESDAFSWCRNISCEEENRDGLSYILTCEYGPFDLVRNPENPLDKPIDLEWDDVVFQAPVDEDIDGNAIVNSAGDPFDPPLMRDQSREVLTITWNQATFDQAWAKSLRDHINTDSFMGSDPYTVKVKGIKGKLEYNAIAGYFWKVQYVFEFKESTWIESILDAGMRQLDPTTGVLDVISIEGTPATTPVPLLDGAPLPDGEDPSYLDFHIYQEISFTSTFNFPFQ